MTRVLFALVLAVPLAGCGDTAPTTAPAKPSSASEIFDKKQVPTDPLGGKPKDNPNPKGG
jgi:hypothetical protein